MSKDIENIDILREVKSELDRFKKRLELAIKDPYSRKNYAAAKRGALDLKNELTKLTQDCKYKYS